MSAPDVVGLVPLADRIRWTGAFRLVVVLAPVLLWLARNELQSGVDALTITAVAVVYLGLTAASAPLLRLGRQVALVAVTLGLLLDGVYLAWAFLALDGFAGPVGYLIVLHAVAVTLLTSFRSGLKVVLWHSITLLVAVEAQITGLAPGALTGQPFPTAAFTVLLAAIWSATLITSTFAAVNERELRRRRYDVEVLRRLALDLERTTDTEQIAALLARLASDELLAPRALVVACPATTAGADLTCATGARPVVSLVPEAVGVDRPAPDGLPVGGAVATALERHATVLVRALDPAADGWVADLLPEAENVVVVPFILPGQVAGALLLEHGRGSRWSRLLRREPRIERRRVATAEQATAHAAQAFGRAALVARLRSSADTDGLTELTNRRAFDRALHAELARSARSGAPTSVLLLDVDHFKKVNDTLGHQAGDEALRAVAATLAATARTGDVTARYGGEEFAVILVATGAQGAAVAAERLREAIARLTPGPPLTASIGVATYPQDGAEATALVAAADAALYRAKVGGRNRVELSSPFTHAGHGRW